MVPNDSADYQNGQAKATVFEITNMWHLYFTTILLQKPLWYTVSVYTATFLRVEHKVRGSPLCLYH